MARPPATAGHRVDFIVSALALLAWVWLFANLLTAHGMQGTAWDFKTYFGACHAFDAGVNPYDIHALRAATGSPHMLPFYYPLSALYVLRPLASLDFVSAWRVWVLLKAVAMAGLLLIWKRQFLSATPWSWLLIVGMLGFGAATRWDIRAGNVSVFEQLFLWTGFVFLLKERAGAFVLCVVFASLFKVTPAAFLFLLLLPGMRSRANLGRVAGGMAAVAALVLLPFAGKPELLNGFLHGLANAHTGLQYNPTVYGALDELAVKHSIALFRAPAVYFFLLAYAAGLLFMSRGLLRQAFTGHSLRGAILIATLLYALLMPRFVIYSYMIVLVPVLALVIPAVSRTKLTTYLALVLLCLRGIVVAPPPATAFFMDFYPFLLLLASWVILARTRIAPAVTSA